MSPACLRGFPLMRGCDYPHEPVFLNNFAYVYGDAVFLEFASHKLILDVVLTLPDLT
jgi:hypothetical protein